MTTRHTILLLLCLGGLPWQASAQLSPSYWEDPEVPRLMFKTNLASLINFNKWTAAATADIRLTPRLSTDVGMGWLISSTFFAPADGEVYRGPRPRLGLKYHFGINDYKTLHLGVLTRYDYITHRYRVNTTRQGGQYRQILLADRRVQTWGGVVRGGVQTYFGKRRQWLLDVYGGIGFIEIDADTRLPPDAEVFQTLQDFFVVDGFYPEGRSSRLDLLIAIHFGYVLW